MTDIDLQPRPLPGTDLIVGPLVLGTMTFGGQLDEAACEQVVRHALDRGVTMLDTAPTYSGGRAEEILGRLLPRLPEGVQVATKVGGRHGIDDPEVRTLATDLIRSTCEQSLRRLGVDHINLYYFHMPEYGTPLEESMGALQGLVDEGKIRAFGMSNHPAWKLVESHRIAERRGWTAPRVNQQVYNLLARRIEDTFLRCTDEIGMANLVFNPVAGGLLTGKYRRDVAPDPQTRFGLNPVYPARYWHDEQFAAVDALKDLAQDSGMDLIDLAFRWLLSRPGVDGVILGVSTLDQLFSNLDAASGPAPDDAICAAIDEIWRTLAGVAPLHYRPD